MPGRNYRLAVIIPQFTVSVKGIVLFADSKIFYNCDRCLKEMNTKIWVYLLMTCLAYLESIKGYCERSNQYIYLYRRQSGYHEAVCYYNFNANSYQPKLFYSVCYKIVISSSNIVHFLSTTINADDPVYYLKIQDSSLSMIEQGAFQSEFYSDLQEIHFPKNNLSRIESGVFKGLNYLSILNLTQNQIETIEDNAFDSLDRLTSLDLSENRLKSIASEYFVGLSKLNKLLLNGNKICTVTNNTFGGLNVFKSLVYLNLAQNQIETIEDKAFESLKTLIDLDLSKNRLKKISLMYFIGLTNLNTLLLHENDIGLIEANAFISLNELLEFNLKDLQIEKLVTNTFAGLTNVNELVLPKHNIQEIEEKAFSGLESLQELDLSLQNFTKILSNTFIGLSNLQNLTLTKNAVDNIEASAFNSTQLNHIDFSLNGLSVIATNFTRDLQTIVAANFSFNLIKILEVDNFDDFMKLATLDLSHNIIEALPVGYFGHLNTLKRLDLSHNHITALEVGTFVGLVSLEFLDLSNNKIVTMPTIVFHNTPQLSSLNVSDNLITNLDPWRLEKFTKLRTININNNLFDCNILSVIIEQFKNLAIELVYGTTRKLTGIHGIICDSNVNITPPTLLDNGTTKTQNFNKSGLSEQLSKYLEANVQLLKESVQESSNTSRQMIELIESFKDVMKNIEKAQIEDSKHSQKQSQVQNREDDLMKLSKTITSETHKSTIIEAVLMLLFVCQFAMLILLVVVVYRNPNILKNRNIFRRSSNNEEQIML